MNLFFKNVRHWARIFIPFGVVVSLSLAFLLTSCGKEASNPANGTEDTENSQPAVVKPSDGSKFECLVENGIPVKVIVKNPDAHAFESFDFTGPSQPLKFFRKYFVFNETERGFQIGDATVKNSRLGWVKKEDVIRWDTNQAIYFINKQDQGKPVPVKVWLSKEDVGDPNKPHFEADLDFKATSEPFPVLRKEGGLVEIAILWDIEHALASVTAGDNNNQIVDLLSGQGVGRVSDGESTGKLRSDVKNIQTEAKRVDIVLAIDVTGSMGPYIEKVRERMLDIVDKLDQIKGPESDVSVGVVAYRDYGEKFVPGSFITKSLPLTKDFDTVRQFLRELEAKGSDMNPYWDEAVFDGLAQAADESMQWGGTHAFKFVCLVGDAGPHDGVDADIQFLQNKGLKVDSPFWGVSFPQGLAMIQKTYTEQNIQLYTFSVGTNESSHLAFERLATSKDYALKLSDDASAFIGMLELKLQNAQERRNQAVTLLEDITTQKKSANNLDDEQLQLLTLVGVHDPQLIQQMAQERIQRGWLAPDEETSSTLCVYVKRSELEDYQLQLMNDMSHKLNGSIDPDVIKDLFKPVFGSDMEGNTINDILRGSESNFYGKSAISLPSISMEATALIENMRQKNNKILILLATKGLFNNYEEGWVPLSQLPVSR